MTTSSEFQSSEHQLTRLYLWDIDGTLLDAGGAGRRALHAAFSSRYRVEAPFRDEAFTGRTDLAIYRDAMMRVLGRTAELDEESAFFLDYLAGLAADVPVSPGYRVLPGIKSLLKALCARPDCRVGLCTGNLRDGAQIKLARGGLDRFFAFGGFGSDSVDRAELTRLAIVRGTELAAGPVEALVIGDSPHEVAAARANGVRVALVATGWTAATELRALEPDLFFDSFADWPTALDILAGGRTPPVVGLSDTVLAARVVKAGGLLVYPTATLYGIGGNAMDPDVAMRVRHIKKGRESSFLVLTDTPDTAFCLAREVPESARVLASRFWPGPLTLVLDASDRVPPHLLGPDGTIAVRVDAHPFPTEISRAAGVPLLSTSANRPGQAAPCRADAVDGAVSSHCDLVVADPSPLAGEPSTLVRVTAAGARILRHGALTQSDIAAVIQCVS